MRTLNDLLGLRDCAPTMPIVFPGQGDLFGAPRQAACLRHEFGFCAGPCAGFITESDYRQRVETAMAFLEGRTIQPIDRVVRAMTDAAGGSEFELAARWREKFEHLEWLLGATSRARSAVDLLSFVYRDPGDFGDDRAYVIRQGIVRALYPVSHDPDRTRGLPVGRLGRRLAAAPPPGPLPLESIDEILLLMSWFRAHPEALRRTTPYAQWS